MGNLPKMLGKSTITLALQCAPPSTAMKGIENVLAIVLELALVTAAILNSASTAAALARSLMFS